MLDMCVLDVLILSKTEKSFAYYHEYCKSHESIKIELPEKGTKISFQNHNRSMRVPFILYADFESFTPQLSTCQPNPDESYTKRYQKHTPSGYCYHTKCFDDTLYSQEPVIFEKEMMMTILHKYLKTYLKRISKTFIKSLSSQKL